MDLSAAARGKRRFITRETVAQNNQEDPMSFSPQSRVSAFSDLSQGQTSVSDNVKDVHKPQVILGQHGCSAFVRVQPKTQSQSLTIPDRNSNNNGYSHSWHGSGVSLSSSAPKNPDPSPNTLHPAVPNSSQIAGGSPGEMLELSRGEAMDAFLRRSDAPPRVYSAPHHGGGIEGDVDVQLDGKQQAVRTKPLVYTPLVLPLSPQYASDHQRDTTAFIGFRPIRRDSAGSESSSLTGSNIDTESSTIQNSSVRNTANSLISKLPPSHPSTSSSREAFAGSLLDMATGGLTAGGQQAKLRPWSLYDGTGGSRTNLSSAGSASSYDNIDKISGFGGDEASSQVKRRSSRSSRKENSSGRVKKSATSANNDRHGSNRVIEPIFGISYNKVSSQKISDGRLPAGFGLEVDKSVIRHQRAIQGTIQETDQSFNNPSSHLMSMNTESKSFQKVKDWRNSLENGFIAQRREAVPGVFHRPIDNKHFHVVPPHLVGVFDPDKIKAAASVNTAAKKEHFRSVISPTSMPESSVATLAQEIEEKEGKSQWPKWQPRKNTSSYLQNIDSDSHLRSRRRSAELFEPPFRSLASNPITELKSAKQEGFVNDVSVTDPKREAHFDDHYGGISNFPFSKAYLGKVGSSADEQPIAAHSVAPSGSTHKTTAEKGLVGSQYAHVDDHSLISSNHRTEKQFEVKPRSNVTSQQILSETGSASKLGPQSNLSNIYKENKNKNKMFDYEQHSMPIGVKLHRSAAKITDMQSFLNSTCGTTFDSHRSQSGSLKNNNIAKSQPIKSRLGTIHPQGLEQNVVLPSRQKITLVTGSNTLLNTSAQSKLSEPLFSDDTTTDICSVSSYENHPSQTNSLNSSTVAANRSSPVKKAMEADEVTKRISPVTSTITHHTPSVRPKPTTHHLRTPAQNAKNTSIENINTIASTSYETTKSPVKSPAPSSADAMTPNIKNSGAGLIASEQALDVDTPKLKQRHRSPASDAIKTNSLTAQNNITETAHKIEELDRAVEQLTSDGALEVFKSDDIRERLSVKETQNTAKSPNLTCKLDENSNTEASKSDSLKSQYRDKDSLKINLSKADDPYVETRRLATQTTLPASSRSGDSASFSFPANNSDLECISIVNVATKINNKKNQLKIDTEEPTMKSQQDLSSGNVTLSDFQEVSEKSKLSYNKEPPVSPQVKTFVEVISTAKMELKIIGEKNSTTDNSLSLGSSPVPAESETSTLSKTSISESNAPNSKDELTNTTACLTEANSNTKDSENKLTVATKQSENTISISEGNTKEKQSTSSETTSAVASSISEVSSVSLGNFSANSATYTTAANKSGVVTASVTANKGSTAITKATNVIASPSQATTAPTTLHGIAATSGKTALTIVSGKLAAASGINKAATTAVTTSGVTTINAAGKLSTASTASVAATATSTTSTTASKTTSATTCASQDLNKPAAGAAVSSSSAGLVTTAGSGIAALAAAISMNVAGKTKTGAAKVTPVKLKSSGFVSSMGTVFESTAVTGTQPIARVSQSPNRKGSRGSPVRKPTSSDSPTRKGTGDSPHRKTFSSPSRKGTHVSTHGSYGKQTHLSPVRRSTGTMVSTAVTCLKSRAAIDSPNRRSTASSPARSSGKHGSPSRSSLASISRSNINSNRNDDPSPTRTGHHQQKKAFPKEDNSASCSKFMESEENKTETSSTKKEICRKEPSPSRKASILNCASRKESASPFEKENEGQNKIEVAVSSKADAPPPSSNAISTNKTTVISGSKACQQIEANKLTDKIKSTPIKINVGHKDDLNINQKTNAVKLQGERHQEEPHPCSKISTVSEHGLTATVTPHQPKINTPESKQEKATSNKPSVVTRTTSVKFVKNPVAPQDSSALNPEKEESADKIPEAIEMAKVSEHFAKKDISRPPELNAIAQTRDSHGHDCSRLNETRGLDEALTKTDLFSHSEPHRPDVDQAKVMKSKSSTSSDSEKGVVSDDDCLGSANLKSVVEIENISTASTPEETPPAVVAKISASPAKVDVCSSSSSSSSESSDNLPAQTNGFKCIEESPQVVAPQSTVATTQKNTESKITAAVKGTPEIPPGKGKSCLSDKNTNSEEKSVTDKLPIIVSFSSVTSESDSKSDSDGGKLPPLAEDLNSMRNGPSALINPTKNHAPSKPINSSAHNHTMLNSISEENVKSTDSSPVGNRKNNAELSKTMSETQASEEIVMAALDDALAMLTSAVLDTKGKATTLPVVTTAKESPKLEGPTVPPRTSVARAYSQWVGDEHSPSSVRRDTSASRTSNNIQYEESRRLEQKIVEINKKYGLIAETAKDDAKTSTKASGENSREVITENGVNNNQEVEEAESSRRKRVAKEDSFNRADSPPFRQPLALPKESVIRRYREKARDSSSSSGSRSRDTSPRTSSPHAVAVQRNARPRQRRKETDHGHSKSHSSKTGHNKGHSSHLSASNERLHTSRPADLDFLQEAAHRRARRSKTTAAVPHRRRKHDWPSLDPSATIPIRSPDWQGPGTIDIASKDSSGARLTSADLSYTSPTSEWTAISNRLGSGSGWKNSPTSGHGSAAIVQRIIERSAAVGGTDCRTSAHNTSTGRSGKIGGSKIGKT